MDDRASENHEHDGQAEQEVDLDAVVNYPETYGYHALPSGARPLNKLRDSHHQIARLLASGMKDVEISAVTGYSQVRISTLKGDPLFQKAMQHYKDNVQEAFVDGLARLNNVFLDSLTELHERVLDEPEAIGTPMLLSMVTELADRAGFGKQSKTTNVHLHAALGNRLDAARQRAAVTRVIDITSAPASPSSSLENGRSPPAAPVLPEQGASPPVASAPHSPESATSPFRGVDSGETNSSDAAAHLTAAE